MDGFARTLSPEFWMTVAYYNLICGVGGAILVAVLITFAAQQFMTHYKILVKDDATGKTSGVVADKAVSCLPPPSRPCLHLKQPVWHCVRVCVGNISRQPWCVCGVCLSNNRLGGIWSPESHGGKHVPVPWHLALSSCLCVVQSIVHYRYCVTNVFLITMRTCILTVLVTVASPACLQTRW